MKKQFLLLLALTAFGSVSAQQNTSDKMIAEVVTKNETMTEIGKTEKKAKKNKSDKKVKKESPKKTTAVKKVKRYYIDSSGQKSYVE